MATSAPHAFPTLSTLHTRHPGVSEGQATSFEEATSWCLAQFHRPPTTFSVSDDRVEPASYSYDWILPSDKLNLAWNNEIDTITTAAYGVVVAAAECHLGLKSFGRLKTGTGADHIMLPLNANAANPADGELDLDAAIRLEVSGILNCKTEGQLRGRLKEKIEELRSGISPLDGLAGVTGFRNSRVAFRRLE